MRIFLVAAYDQYYPSGPQCDLLNGICLTREEAEKRAETMVNNNDYVEIIEVDIEELNWHICWEKG